MTARNEAPTPSAARAEPREAAPEGDGAAVSAWVSLAPEGSPAPIDRSIGGEHQRFAQPLNAAERRPIVVWNLTRTCNLKCVHCYSDSEARRYPGELTTQQCMSVLDDLAEFKVPAVLFSGGEPLVRPDLFEAEDVFNPKGWEKTFMQ